MANQLHNKHLRIKVFKALIGRVERHKTLRKDLIKRYWINNSDDEDVGESTGLPGGERNGDVPKLKDEFFPVTIVQKKNIIRVADLSQTFEYDILEPKPEFLQLKGRC